MLRAQWQPPPFGRNLQAVGVGTAYVSPQEAGVMPIEGLLILPAEKGRSRIDRNKQRPDPHLEAVALPMVAF
jgi:hypothetical protein